MTEEQGITRTTFPLWHNKDSLICTILVLCTDTVVKALNQFLHLWQWQQELGQWQ